MKIAAVILFVMWATVAGAQQTADQFVFPVDDYTATRCFGWGADPGNGTKHVAEDVQCHNDGAEVRGAANGKVMFARANGTVCDNWGPVIVIEHTLPDNSKVCTIYGHVDIEVNEHDNVGINARLGSVGNFSCPGGWTNHLHFGIYIGAYGAAIGTYPGWLKGYLPTNEFPGNYVKPSDYIDASGGSNQTSWLFENDGNFEGWQVAGVTSASVSGGRLKMNPASDPRAVSPYLFHPPVTHDYIKIGVWNRGSDQRGRVYFDAPDRGYSEDRKATFDCPRSTAEDFRWISVWTGGINDWQGRSNINHIRIDPVVDGIPVSGSDEVQFDYIFRRIDNHDPDIPTITKVPASGWHNGAFTITLSANDPSDRPSNPVGPDAYGSGVRSFFYRVDPQGDTEVAPGNFNDRTGEATVTLSITPPSQGTNVFHAYVRDKTDHYGHDDQVNLKYDNVPPTKPGNVHATGHTVSTWSNDNTIRIDWNHASDATSGRAGYSWKFDTSPSGTPNNTINGTGTTVTSGALSNGSNHYFHIKTQDNAGNWSGVETEGPFWIDTSSPSNPGNVHSTSHTASQWSSDNTIEMTWNASSDSHSGVAGYSWAFNSTPNNTVNGPGPPATSGVLVSGSGHEFFVKAKDNAGNWSSVVSAGSYYIDTTQPVNQ
jgi:hypothetical protein